MSIGNKIQTILEESGIPFVRKSHSLITDCISPTCPSPEEKFWIRIADGACICFRCKFTCDAVGLTARIRKISFDQAYSLVHGSEAGERIASRTPLAHITFETFEIEEESESEVNPSVNLWYLHPASVNANAVAQLKKRGVSLECAEKMGLRSHPALDAVFFIARDPSDSFDVGYQYRNSAPVAGQPKTVTMRGFRKNLHCLFIEKVSNVESLAIVEGPYDAMMCWAGGLPAVATYGKLVSEEQIKMIEALPCKTVFVGLDPDAAKEARNLIDRLSQRKVVYRLLPPAGRKDLGECTPEDIELSVMKAQACSGANTDRLEVFLKPEINLNSGS